MRIPVLLASVLAPTPALCQVVNEPTEPNGSVATAPTLPAGQQADGEIVPMPSGYDEDWYRIVLPQAADLRAWTGPGFVRPIGDTRLALRNGVGTLIVEVDDGDLLTHGFYSVITLGNVPAGTYFLAVRGRDAPTVGAYTLDCVQAPVGTYAQGPLTPLFEGPENNDVRSGGFATQAAIGTRSAGNVLRGGLGTSWSPVFAGPEDYDFFQFSLAAPALVTLETRGGAGLPIADTVLHLVDASMQRVAFDDDGGSGTFSRLSFGLPAGVWFAVVSGFGANDAGSYELDIVVAAPPAPNTIASVVIRSGGCLGSLGVPYLSTRPNSFGFPGRPEQPLLGSTFVLDLVNVPSNVLLTTVVDLTAVSPPISLGPKAPGCLAELSLSSAVPNIRAAGGSGYQWIVPIPMDRGFVGLPLEMQIAVWDQNANAAGISLSNRCSLRCGLHH